MHHLEFDKPKVLRHAPQSTSTKLACCTLHSSGMDTRAHGCTTRYRFPDWCLHKQLRTWGGWKSAITSLVDTPRQNIWLSWAFIRPDIRPGCWLLVSAPNGHRIFGILNITSKNHNLWKHQIPWDHMRSLTSIFSEWTQWTFPRSSITSRQRLDLAQEPVSNPQW